ncbi:MAG: D-alanyl-D-alanine carboxypeptidase [SAR324 cluster bacterium]|nr:D-alanyl-D-alanine carboxypeptidase [SAR324 cluster bacterium]
MVADDHAILYSRNSDELFVPASIWKLATALVALHYLGPNYRFQTETYLNQQGDLTLKGYGDPQLVSEELIALAKELSQSPKIPGTLRNLYLDNSSFASEINVHGLENTLNPYDALNGALVANYNTINVMVGKDGQIQSAEKQTPLTSIAVQLAQDLDPGKHRINISRSSQYILPYIGSLFAALLKIEGVNFSGSVQIRSIQKTDQLVFTHQNSNTLKQTIAGMMLYSNNFIANQLFLSTGMKVYGAPAETEKGRKALQGFLENDLKINPRNFQFVEGSGISRKNKITGQAMLRVLKAFRPYKSLLARHMGVRLKTGTLRGVYTMAGYLPDESRNLYFVIMLNQKRNYRDKILSLLLKENF